MQGHHRRSAQIPERRGHRGQRRRHTADAAGAVQPERALYAGRRNAHQAPHYPRPQRAAAHHPSARHRAGADGGFDAVRLRRRGGYTRAAICVSRATLLPAPVARMCDGRFAAGWISAQTEKARCKGLRCASAPPPLSQPPFRLFQARRVPNTPRPALQAHRRRLPRPPYRPFCALRPKHAPPGAAGAPPPLSQPPVQAISSAPRPKHARLGAASAPPPLSQPPFRLFQARHVPNTPGPAAASAPPPLSNPRSGCFRRAASQTRPH